MAGVILLLLVIFYSSFFLFLPFTLQPVYFLILIQS